MRGPTGEKIGKKPFDGILTWMYQCSCLESISTQQAFNLFSAIFNRRETTESSICIKMSFPSLCIFCDLFAKRPDRSEVSNIAFEGFDGEIMRIGEYAQFCSKSFKVTHP